MVVRDSEYGYAINLSDEWVESDRRPGRYARSSPWSRVYVTSHSLRKGSTLRHFAESVRDGLGRDWWPTRSLLQITSFQESQIDGQDAYLITYRVQESPEYCVVDVTEIVMVSVLLPGNPQGFRVRVWMCERSVPQYGPERKQILESFSINIREATYYTQFLSVKGVIIKATGKVDTAAFDVAADTIRPMLSGREDLSDCMADAGGGLAIIPRDEYVTTLPEYAYLKGRSDFTGRTYESFQLRGLGGVKGQPVSSTSEESLLRLDVDEYPYGRFPFDSLITVHEYAHGIQNLCFTQDDHERWNGFYASAQQANIFPGTHMMTNEEEFFAVFSTAYFEVTDEIGRGADRSTIRETYSDVYEFLEEIYQGAVLSPELRSRRSR